ncbi:hypothetical protein KW790_03220 [Candidatus Parcubacteria bacterium]|nr:hypothetical protein [Candidatus Parcubacteria bacterium]
MKKSIIRLALLTLAILLIPLVMMKFSSNWNWSIFDFVFMGSLIFGTGLAYLYIARQGSTTDYRRAVGVAAVASLLLVWINAAVGIIGDGYMTANLMYLGVIVTGFIGAFIGHFKPTGMSRAAFSMAVAQMLVPVIILVIAAPQITEKPPGVVGVFILNGIFALMFLTSAFFFRRASVLSELR